MSSLRKLSLSTKLTLLAVLTLIPIALLTVLSSFQDRNQRRDRAIQDADTYAASLAAGFESFAVDLQSLALAASLALENQPLPISQQSSQPFLRSLAQHNPLLRAIFVTDLDGKVIAQNEGDDTGRDLSSRPYIVALKQGATTAWSGGLEGIQTGQVTVAFARTIPGFDGQPRGYLVIAFYPVNFVDRLPTDLPADANFVLIDQYGRQLLSLRSPDHAGQDVLGAYPEIRRPLAGETLYLRDEDTPFDSDRRFGAITPLPSMKWAVAYTRSQSELNSTLQARLVRDLGVLALIGLATVGLLIILGRQISRPLRRLARTATEIQAGMPISPLKPTADPDVNSLQSAFLTMSVAVREREEQLATQSRLLGELDAAAAQLTSSLDLSATVQAVTDIGARLAQAEFGAFFYNTREGGGAYELYTLSGADATAFNHLPMPRATEIFGATFSGEGVVRLDDVTADPRYGQNPPYFGMPPGHLPVRSYLALPVISSKRVVVGGLFFGHPEPGQFTEHHEELAKGIASWAGIALDNARLYKESQDAQDELVQANRAKDDFLGLVSHEMRTPITIMQAGTTLLSERGDALGPNDRASVLRDLVDGAQRLSQLVDNILALTSVERLAEVSCEPVLLRPVIERLSAQLQRRSPGRTVETNLDRHAIGLGSRLYVEQIVGNLLSNADKYSPAGKPIVVSLRAEAHTVSVSVRDHGIGLSADDRENLFQAHYRGREARRVASGFGLGLAVCKRLADALGGELDYADAEGGGAEFTIRLPNADEFDPMVDPASIEIRPVLAPTDHIAAPSI